MLRSATSREDASSRPRERLPTSEPPTSKAAAAGTTRTSQSRSRCEDGPGSTAPRRAVAALITPAPRTAATFPRSAKWPQVIQMMIWGQLPAEEPLADTGGRLAVIQRAELGDESLVCGAITGPRRPQVPDRGQYLIRRGQERPGGLRLEGEVEPAQVVAVLLEVVGEEDHRPARGREVEHDRRVVRDEDIGGQEELGYIRIAGHIESESGPLAGRDVVGQLMVSPDQDHVVGSQNLVRPFQVEPKVEPVASGCVVLVVAPGGRVEHHPLASGQAQPAPYPRRDGTGVVTGEHVVAWVTGLPDLALELESLPHDGRAERVRGEQRVPLGHVVRPLGEVAPAAGELRLLDVEPDPLQRRAVPGLQVHLPVALAVEVVHVVVGYHVSGAGQRRVVLLAPVQDHGRAGRGDGGPVGHRPEVLTVITAAAQFVCDRTRVVVAPLALPARSEEHMSELQSRQYLV